MSDRFPFPERMSLWLFKDLTEFCMAAACHGDLDKAAKRTAVLKALITHARPLWEALVQRLLSSSGGPNSVPIDHPTYDPADPTTWFKPTAYEWLVLDFRLLLHSGFLFFCQTLEHEPARPLAGRRNRTDATIQNLQNDVADFLLAWLDECKHGRAAAMRGQILGLETREDVESTGHKPSPTVSRSQDRYRTRLNEKSKRRRGRPQLRN